MQRRQHSSHWGAFVSLVEDGRLVGVEPFEHDPHPSPIIDSVPEAVYAENRIRAPMVRKSWLDHGPEGHTDKRGADAFVEVDWDTALDLVARELERVKRDHGPASIFGGSYGWSSAGRFHHAKSQLQRFLGQFGGFTNQVFSYSNAAGHAILPYLFGEKGLGRGPFTSWQSIHDHTDLFVSFGGLGLKNTQVEPGGMGEHGTHKWLPRLKAGKTRFVSITPLKDDTADYLGAEWLSPRPNTDVALMLGLAHTLWAEDLHDRQFLATHCVGYEHFEAYLTGRDDGQPKDADWAANICALDATTIRDLARRMAAGTTMIGIAYALQRAEHGEQTYWMTATLAAMLGQIGAPGGGCGFGYGSMNGYGVPVPGFKAPAMPPATNPADSAIPVARISDMLLHPGEPYDFNGERRTYPDIRLVYWCGGNPFHHHQDLNRLVDAWRKPETIVVNEIWWTATARYADIVLPATSTLERNDIGTSSRDRFVLAMQQAIEPVGEARNDFEIFSGLASRCGFEEQFTEGRDEMDWLRHIYDIARQQTARSDLEMPDFDTFWENGHIEFPEPAEAFVQFGAFYLDPAANPLKTPSGKVELFSATIDSYGYDDCPGHATWLEPQEWLGGARADQFPLHMISNQPAGKLHSQMDGAVTSRATKVNGREPVVLHPADAQRRGIADGDLVRVFNDRGALLASAVVSADVRESVIRVATGAWYDPVTPGQPGALDKHGNPNVLTPDWGTSKLAQGPIAHSALVEVEAYTGPDLEVTAFAVPDIVAAES
ncbi:MAG: molybdopterin guanine dinucleotide-containing S/N-oxide reductase [Pseudomonadota bacterium]